MWCLPTGRSSRPAPMDERDLFWAIRGGGGNFGVVTSFLFRLHPVDTVVAGPTLWPLDAAADVMRWYRDFIVAAPNDLNGFFAFLTVPPGAAVSRAAAPQEDVRRRLVSTPAAADRAEERYSMPAQSSGQPAAPRGSADAVPGPPERIRRALSAGAPVVLVCRFRQRAFRRGDCPAYRAWRCDCRRLQSTMHLYPINGGAHDVGQDRHRLQLSRREVGRSHRRRRSRPGRRTPSIIAWAKTYWDGAPSLVRRWRLRQLHDGRRRGAGAGDLSATTTPGSPRSSASTTRTTSSASTRTCGRRRRQFSRSGCARSRASSRRGTSPRPGSRGSSRARPPSPRRA